MKNTENFGSSGTSKSFADAIFDSNYISSVTGDQDKLQIIFNGDSWTFGCEIADPKIAKRYSADVHPGVYDYLKENDKYRLPRIYPHFMAQELDADYVNLSWPADDNNTILQRTISYITTNYINQGLPTDKLFVIIGWTSPERNSFWWRSDKYEGRFRVWPNVANFEDSKMKKFWDPYVAYTWHPEEYIVRHVLNVLQFQNFCNQHNIKWLSYNAFYQVPKEIVERWHDLNMAKELKTISDRLGFYQYYDSKKPGRAFDAFDFRQTWATIDPVRFYKKDQDTSTFRSFIEKNVKKPLTGWHPSPAGHKAWAKELVRYVQENKLLP